MKTARRLMLLLCTGLLVFAWLPFAPVAKGIENETFGVTPFPERMDGVDRRTFSIPLETGAVFEDAVRIYNNTDQTINLNVYATDANTAPDDTISVGLRDDNLKGVGKWIDLSRQDVELAAREDVTVTFRVKVRSSDPSPNLGAIVVENTGRGLTTNAIQRLHILVRTGGPNTPTTSTRVRSFLLRSPWVAIALLGLVVAGAIVYVGARRARRPRDAVVGVGELDTVDDHTDDAPEASRPVIKRLGALAGDPVNGERTSVLDRVRASAGASRRRDDRPLVDDTLLVEIDQAGAKADGKDASEAEPTRQDTPAVKVPMKAQVAKRKPEAKPVQPARQRASSAKQARGASTSKDKPKSAAKRKAPAKARPGAKKSAAKKSAAKKKVTKKPSAKSSASNYIPLKNI